MYHHKLTLHFFRKSQHIWVIRIATSILDLGRFSGTNSTIVARNEFRGEFKNHFLKEKKMTKRKPCRNIYKREERYKSK